MVHYSFNRRRRESLLLLIIVETVSDSEGCDRCMFEPIAVSDSEGCGRCMFEPIATGEDVTISVSGILSKCSSILMTF